MMNKTFKMAFIYPTGESYTADEAMMISNQCSDGSKNKKFLILEKEETTLHNKSWFSKTIVLPLIAAHEPLPTMRYIVESSRSARIDAKLRQRARKPDFYQGFIAVLVLLLLSRASHDLQPKWCESTIDRSNTSASNRNSVYTLWTTHLVELLKPHP